MQALLVCPECRALVYCCVSCPTQTLRRPHTEVVSFAFSASAESVPHDIHVCSRCVRRLKDKIYIHVIDHRSACCLRSNNDIHYASRIPVRTLCHNQCRIIPHGCAHFVYYIDIRENNFFQIRFGFPVPDNINGAIF